MFFYVEKIWFNALYKRYMYILHYFETNGLKDKFFSLRFMGTSQSNLYWRLMPRKICITTSIEFLFFNSQQIIFNVYYHFNDMKSSHWSTQNGLKKHRILPKIQFFIVQIKLNDLQFLKFLKEFVQLIFSILRRFLKEIFSQIYRLL